MTPFRGRSPENAGVRTAVAIVIIIGCSALFRVLDQLLLLRWPRLFVAAIRVYWAGLFASPYREGSFARKVAARRAGMSEAELRYGEVPIFVARRALKKAGVDKASRVCDLGAGRGRILLAARSLGAQAVGIELLDEQRLPVEAALASVGAELIPGDLLQADVSDFTHVWVTWTCMSETRRTKLLARLAAELPPGAIVLGVSFEPRGDRFQALFSTATWATWGSVTVSAARVSGDAA